MRETNPTDIVNFHPDFISMCEIGSCGYCGRNALKEPLFLVVKNAQLYCQVVERSTAGGHHQILLSLWLEMYFLVCIDLGVGL